MSGFQDDPQHPGGGVWRHGSGSLVLPVIGLTIIGTVALGMSGLGVWAVAVGSDFRITLMIAGLSASMWGMAAYVRRDMQGKRGGTIAISDAGIDLDLAANRSLIHRPRACRVHFDWSAVAGLLTREEAYGAQGMAMLQRPWWLAPKDGAPILLFEERAITSRIQDASMRDIANEIAGRGALAITELPLAVGKGGILGVWFVRPPSIDAGPLGPAAERWIMRRVWFTSVLVGLAGLAVLLMLVLG